MGTKKAFRVVVGLDLSDLSEEVARSAFAIGRTAPGGELHFVHALPLIPVADLGSSVDAAIAAARAEVEAIVGRLDTAGLPFTLHLAFGRSDEVVLATADRLEADTIVVGTHDPRGLERLLLGSTAESVVRKAHCSVLTVRPRRVATEVVIEPPCADCVAAQTAARASAPDTAERARCERHTRASHGRAHTYAEVPQSFAMGSMTFRFDT